VYDVIGTEARAPNAESAATQSPASPGTDVAWLVGVGDPADAPRASFVIVQELFMTELAQRADVVLPALSFAEREGTFTSGDRRVQRLYRALPALGQAKPDWWIIQEVAKRLGAVWNFQSAGQIFVELSQRNRYYVGLSYESISRVEEQWPPVGREDLYYGGTAYDNSGGVGGRYAAGAERDGFTPAVEPVSPPEPTIGALERLPRLLYQDGLLIRLSPPMASHIEYGPAALPRAAK
jgi:NADH-quinone oxidoreductase subunit G